MTEKRTHSFNTVFILIVFSLFAVCSLFLVLIGANVYKNIVDDMRTNNETRASLSYVANKVHAAGTGETAMRTIDGRQVLVLTSEANGEIYHTYIYEDGGYLLELFTRAENGFKAGDGDKITPVSGFSMAENDGLLIISVNGKGDQKLNLSISEGG